jgi:hypothetical protein
LVLLGFTAVVALRCLGRSSARATVFLTLPILLVSARRARMRRRMRWSARPLRSAWVVPSVVPLGVAVVPSADASSAEVVVSSAEVVASFAEDVAVVARLLSANG